MTLAVPARRELARLRRLRKLGLILAVVAAFMWSRILSGRGPLPNISLGDDAVFWLPGLVIISLLAAVMILPMLGQGRSPHVAYRADRGWLSRRQRLGEGSGRGRPHSQGAPRSRQFPRRAGG